MSKPVCVITGATRGIGLATALRFARGGHDVVAVARNESDLRSAARQISSAGAECLTVAADVGEPAAAERIVHAATERFARLDVLVNNAGIAPLAPTTELSPDDFARVFAVNMAAIFHLTRAAWPPMVRQQAGVIVNLSSRASADPFPGFSAYGASKAWVNTFTRAVAVEGRPHNIRVFAVAPGAVETSLLRSAFPDLPREATLDPDDVAAVIESVCDDRMRSATGETIFVMRK